MRTHKCYDFNGTPAGQLVEGPSESRQAIILGPPTAGYYWITLGNPTGAPQDFLVPAASAPLILTREMLGEKIVNEIHVTGVGTGLWSICVVNKS